MLSRNAEPGKSKQRWEAANDGGREVVPGRQERGRGGVTGRMKRRVFLITSECKHSSIQICPRGCCFAEVLFIFEGKGVGGGVVDRFLLFLFSDYPSLQAGPCCNRSCSSTFAFELVQIQFKSV